MARRSDHSREQLHRMALDAALNMTEQDGLRGLKARRVARDIGYTIGTIYNLFDDLDDLIVHMNAETLGALYTVCSTVPLDGGPEENLRALAQRYLQYTRAHPKLWNAVIEHHFPENRQRPACYSEQVAKLLRLEEKALEPLFNRNEDAQLQHHALVLWTSLFGMAAVESAKRLLQGETAEALVDTLIDVYVAGLRKKAETAN